MVDKNTEFGQSFVNERAEEVKFWDSINSSMINWDKESIDISERYILMYQSE